MVPRTGHFQTVCLSSLLWRFSVFVLFGRGFRPRYRISAGCVIMATRSDRAVAWCDWRGGTSVAAGIGTDTRGSADKDREAQVLARKLDYLIGQITPEEFRRQDANYDQDSALGRELLFLIANNEWARATSESIDIARSDTVDTTIKIDVNLSRIAHEAFRGRAGPPGGAVAGLPAAQPVALASACSE